MSNEYAFFLSYARRDAKGDGGNENPWFKRFYKELVRDVAVALAIPSAVPDKDIAFYDRDGIPAGAEWSGTLAEALQSSKVFVCLLSNSYFKSEYCGKEFQLFSDRISHLGATGGPQLIIPVKWQNPQDLAPYPAVLAAMQDSDRDLGLEYGTLGLEPLMRKGRDKKTEYYDFLRALVTKIRLAAENKPSLPRLAQLPALAKVKSAFHAIPVTSAIGTSRPPRGIKIAWFVYAVGADVEYQQINRTTSCYGPNGMQWLPFHPGDENLVSYYAAWVALNKGLTPHNVEIGDDFIEKLMRAEEENTAVVIIVDPWSLKIPAFENCMKAYDATRLMNTSVIVLWNDQDQETQQKRQSLEQLLVQTFLRNSLTKEISFQPYISSAEELRNKLGAAIDEVKNRLLQRAKLQRGEIGLSGDPLPKLPTPNTAP